jgi:phage terminase large subunit-like protein
MKISQELLSAIQAEAIKRRYDWTGRHARHNQQIPDGDWAAWLILAGRGFGKTRTGAETVRQWIKDGFNYVNLIGATADDARDIMIEGESGILKCCPKAERPIYQAHKSRLVWPNGAVSLVFTADAPERLRGKQHQKGWADELCAWRYHDAWDQYTFGLRLGKKPQTVITTTPKPSGLLKVILSDPKTHVTRGSTYDNRANLAKSFMDDLIKKYEGTRLGRQELDAEVLDDIEGALWSDSQIMASHGVVDVNKCRRIVIGVDPSGSMSGKGDLVGIVVAGQYPDDRYCVIADLSMPSNSPDAWARTVCGAYERFKADSVICETNFGGNLVVDLLRRTNPRVRVKTIHASRGKHVRAAPIAALYEQGRVCHNGRMTELEGEMAMMAESGYCGSGSPDRLDAMVWALTELSEGTARPDQSAKVVERRAGDYRPKQVAEVGDWKTL